jgi:hypothetical protein
MLLWPRLDRAKIRKVADNPARIAEIVAARTSQPYDVILAMLTRPTPAPGWTAGFVRPGKARGGDTAPNDGRGDVAS